MSQGTIPSTHQETGAHPETLSNEVLKLKIDDLFQEIENLKLRVARLEGQAGPHVRSGPEGTDPSASGTVSNPDH